MRKKRFFDPAVAATLCVTCIITAATAFLNIYVFYASLALTVAVAVYAIIRGVIERNNFRTFLRSIEATMDVADIESLQNFPLPVCAVGSAGDIKWFNDSFCDNVVPSQKIEKGASFLDIFPKADIESIKKSPRSLSFDERKYTVYAGKCTGFHDVTIIYFTDDTELKGIVEEYEKSRPSVAIVMIDNYDELLQDVRESEKTRLLSEIEYTIEETVAKTSGFITRLERDRFMCVMEERHMAELIKNKFAILNEIRGLSSSHAVSPTISIGVGRGLETLSQCETAAKTALDMALGRGGDQVAVKSKEGFEFFGGFSSGIEKRTKVKTRMIATTLAGLISECDNAIIMGHRFGDLDCVGAAAGLCCAIRKMSKPAYICANVHQSLAGELIDRLAKNGYDELIISEQKAISLASEKTLLLIVDTHNPNFIESKELYEKCQQVVVIDHHRKMVGHISNAVMFYHEPYASSASEMVTELIQYLGDNIKIGRPEAEALLSGIMLDTKNFVLKTGVRTFEAAAYLRRLGADTVEVRKLFSSSMDEYLAKSKLVAAAEIFRGCAVAVADGEVDGIRLVSAKAADELLSISGVKASFVLYESGTEISVSARSMGEINVQIIVEELGGGGHLTMAGAQLKNITADDARQMVLDAISKHCAE